VPIIFFPQGTCDITILTVDDEIKQDEYVPSLPGEQRPEYQADRSPAMAEAYVTPLRALIVYSYIT
jgi:hypothetical protein